MLLFLSAADHLSFDLVIAMHGGFDQDLPKSLTFSSGKNRPRHP